MMCASREETVTEIDTLKYDEETLGKLGMVHTGLLDQYELYLCRRPM
jgi:hypothetical protein